MRVKANTKQIRKPARVWVAVRTGGSKRGQVIDMDTNRSELEDRVRLQYEFATVDGKSMYGAAVFKYVPA